MPLAHRDDLVCDFLSETPPSASSRLFVGNLTMHSGDPVSLPEPNDEVLVGLAGGSQDSGHPDFLWSPIGHITNDLL